MKYLSNITEGFDLFYDNFSADKSCAFRGTKEIKTFNRTHYGIMIILKVNSLLRGLLLLSQKGC